MPPEPGTVRVTLAGDAQDLLRLSVFLEAVTRGHDPAEALANLHLAAIAIVSARNTPGRATGHITMMIELRDAA